MKKFLFLLASTLLLLAPQAFAGKSSGCGLGSVVFKGSSGFISNLSAATTNGTSGNQTFGITSGTSNCDAGDTVQLQKQREVFVAQNGDLILEDMAKGQGEYLLVYSRMMGCSAQVDARFAQVTQANAGYIFEHSKVAGDVLSKTREVLTQDQELKSACAL